MLLENRRASAATGHSLQKAVTGPRTPKIKAGRDSHSGVATGLKTLLRLLLTKSAHHAAKASRSRSGTPDATGAVTVAVIAGVSHESVEL